MNTSLPVPNQGPWPLGAYNPESGQPVRGQRNYSAVNVLDVPTLIRILHHWRWLVLGAVGLGVVGAILITLLTHPVYRAWVTLEANPPSFSVSANDKGTDDAASSQSTYDFVVTQVGLIESRSVAERAAQETNLPNDPTVVDQRLDASKRLQVATGLVSGGLKVTPPVDGSLIKFSYDSTSPQLAASVANAVADGFINAAIQRRYESSAYARSFLERQINKTRTDLERSERSLVAYAQAQGIINTGSGSQGQQGAGSGDANSLQGASLVELNNALAEATAKRVAAEGAYRQALATGPNSAVTQSTLPMQQQLAQLSAVISKSAPT